MGLLALGTALGWEDAKKNAQHVREWGIEQLLAIWRRAKGKERDALLWGDEVEYLVVAYDDPNRRVDLSLRQADILVALAKDEELCKQGGCVPALQTTPRGGEYLPTFHPEFGRFMLEATPGKPWGIGFKDLLDVERNMKWRRTIAKDHMAANESPITMTNFPRLGAAGVFTSPYYPPHRDTLRSQFVPDEVVNPHIRFPTLAANIRQRRGRKVEINVPIFRDCHTPWPFRDPTVDYDLHRYPEDDDVRNGAVKDNCIYMDAMVFGMGSCCLQITFQAKNINEGRRLYDQLSPLGPIMLALTAATPIYKGFLADTDVRWNQISASVDDRTAEELGEKPLQQDRWRIPKSRYASNSTYISQDPELRAEYLDADLIVDEDLKRRLMDGGMDERLATHFAHLFIRDPLVVFAEDLKRLDLDRTDHFENLQSTNWQHMRFKPPPPPPSPHDGDKDTGWRVEFRPMEIQMTDFENAAFAVFVVLVTRAILSFDLNFYVPISKVDENMQTAHRRDAVNAERFYFRKNPLPSRPYKHTAAAATAASSLANGVANGVSGASTPHHISSRPPSPPPGPVEDEYELMTIDEIINGQQARPPTDPHSQTQPQTPPSSTSSSPSAPTTLHQPRSHSEGKEEGFPGLIPLVETYLDSVNVDVETRCELGRYLGLIKNRASGRLWTGAKWIREFVRAHPEYRGDSVVGEGVCYDLVRAVERLGAVNCAEAGIGAAVAADGVAGGVAGAGGVGFGAGIGADGVGVGDDAGIDADADGVGAQVDSSYGNGNAAVDGEDQGKEKGRDGGIKNGVQIDGRLGAEMLLGVGVGI